MTLKKTHAVNRIAFIGSYVPRRCGIATFTGNLTNALVSTYRHADVLVVPINDVKGGYAYPPTVWFEVQERAIDSYRRAADFLNINDVDVVSVQHEFGIFGGPAGSHILTLIRDLRMPVVVTLHTVLRDPDKSQRRVMERLAAVSDRLVVMTDVGRRLLEEIYEVPPEKIDVIPHGIPDMPFIDPNFYKDNFRVEGRRVLLTFGLLGPGKGIEHMINALPAVVQKHPDVVYMVLGATHPGLLREQGELYRLSLQRLARERGVDEHVIFHNRFVSEQELSEFLSIADVYVTPYVNTAQICSGTLAYAMGAGKAVVSTPYWHAEELLADDRGVLVPVGDAPAMAEAINGLLDDSMRLHAMRKRAYLAARGMIWPKVAQMYMASFEEARRKRVLQPAATVEMRRPEPQMRELPVLKLDHLRRLTDGTGLIQHATYNVPRYSEGYTTDDNARALILAALLEDTFGDLSIESPGLTSRYMGVLEYAFNPQTGRFRNFLSYERHWLEEEGSEDAQGRALWALGTLVAHRRRAAVRQWAASFFEQALPVTTHFRSPRAWAFALLGLDEYLSRFSGDRIASETRRELAARLLDLYRLNQAPNWPWFEDALTYSNARLPHALLVTGRATEQPDLVEAALKSLGWLAEIQRAEEGHFVPIGCHGFYPRGGERARFDQQPIEAQGMISACLEAFRQTGDGRWREEAQRAFDWFLGYNDRGEPLYDPVTGGCHDGLGPDYVNANQGAESTLAFLLGLTEMRLAEHPMDLAEQDLVPDVRAAVTVQTRK